MDGLFRGHDGAPRAKKTTNTEICWVQPKTTKQSEVSETTAARVYLLGTPKWPKASLRALGEVHEDGAVDGVGTSAESNGAGELSGGFFPKKEAQR